LDRFTGILGILAVLLAAWLGSTNRNRIRWRTVAWGLGLQVCFAFLVLRFDYGQRFMTWAGSVVNSMLSPRSRGHRFYSANWVCRIRALSENCFRQIPARFSRSRFCRRSFSSLPFRGALPHRVDAADHSRHGLGDAEDDAHFGCGEHERGGEHFHGADRGSLTIRPFLSKATRSELM